MLLILIGDQRLSCAWCDWSPALTNRSAEVEPELVGIAMKRQKPIADQVHRRLMTGAKQQDDIGGQFLSCRNSSLHLL
jgi:hypothetical protein